MYPNPTMTQIESPITISLSNMKLLTIDIFGTLFVPRPSVAAQYLSLVNKYEHVTSRPNHVTTIQNDFAHAFKHNFQKYPWYGKDTIGYESWWIHVIKESFPHDNISRDTAHKVYSHFGTSSAYHLYPDVIPLLSQVKSMGFRIAALSNMDPKANDILRDFGLLKYLDEVILSYDTEIEKPAISAWKNVEREFGVSERYYNSLYHVGDEPAKDLVSIPGWTSVLIDRSEGFTEYDGFAQKRAKKMRDGVLRVKEDQFVVKSLADVPDLLV